MATDRAPTPSKPGTIATPRLFSRSATTGLCTIEPRLSMRPRSSAASSTISMARRTPKQNPSDEAVRTVSAISRLPLEHEVDEGPELARRLRRHGDAPDARPRASGVAGSERRDLRAERGGVGAACPREHDRQRLLAARHVGADGLPGARGVAPVPERVVDRLEGDAQVHPRSLK